MKHLYFIDFHGIIILSMTNHNAPLEPELSPNAVCVETLLHLAEVQPPSNAREMQGAGEYFAAINRVPAPQDLTTRLVVYPKDPAEDSTVGVTVQFHSEQADRAQTNVQSLEIQDTPEGLELRRKLRPASWDDNPKYETLTDQELEALTADAASIRKQIVAKNLARLQLGELVDTEVDEDGRRNFHVGDITSVITGVSPRGEEGLIDILHFMTGQSPHSTQIGRFIMEAAPSIVRQVPELSDFMPQLQQADKLTVPELHQLIEEIGAVTDGAFKKIEPLDPSEHTTMNPIDEIELDTGESRHRLSDYTIDDDPK